MIYGSVTRITDLEDSEETTVEPIEREKWATGDYVVARVAVPPTGYDEIETASGWMVPVEVGDRVVGAFGRRFATLEAVGDWRDIGPDGAMHAMTAAGLMGRVTSRSKLVKEPLNLRYEGHVHVDGCPVSMKDYVEPVAGGFDIPTVLIIGSSMSAGKTTSARTIIRLLVERGHAVVGAKLTGAARFRDILAMRQAGARPIFDFVDAGLPSTVVPTEEVYRPAIRGLLPRIGRTSGDVLVAESGASPLEPYNGEACVEELGENVRFTLLCASDPYAVLGVMEAFGRRPDLVAGTTTNTEAGIALVEKLTDVPALNLRDPASRDPLWRMLKDRLSLSA